MFRQYRVQHGLPVLAVLAAALQIIGLSTLGWVAIEKFGQTVVGAPSGLKSDLEAASGLPKPEAEAELRTRREVVLFAGHVESDSNTVSVGFRGRRATDGTDTGTEMSDITGDTPSNGNIVSQPNPGKNKPPVRPIKEETVTEKTKRPLVRPLRPTARPKRTPSPSPNRPSPRPKPTRPMRPQTRPIARPVVTQRVVTNTPSPVRPTVPKEKPRTHRPSKDASLPQFPKSIPRPLPGGNGLIQPRKPNTGNQKKASDGEYSAPSPSVTLQPTRQVSIHRSCYLMHTPIFS